jgi:hypothetical protein
MSQPQYSLITPPTAEPLTLDEAKAHLRIYSTDEDHTVARCLKAARQRTESLTGRQLMPATWMLTMDAWPNSGTSPTADLSEPDSIASWVGRRDGIRLRRSPVTAVTSVQYLSSSTGALTTLNSSAYELVPRVEPGLLIPAYGSTWPSARAQPGAVRITFTAGYTSVSLIPEELRHYILLVLTDLYEHREPTLVGTIQSRLAFADRLLDEWTVR